MLKCMYFYEKYFPKQKKLRVAFIFFANLLNAWLNRRELDYPICFFIQYCAICFLVDIHKENLAFTGVWWEIGRAFPYPF